MKFEKGLNAKLIKCTVEYFTIILDILHKSRGKLTGYAGKIIKHEDKALTNYREKN